MEEFRSSVKKGFLACKTDIEFLNNENQELKLKINEILKQKNELQENSKILKETLENTIEKQNEETSNLKIELQQFKNENTQIKEELKQIKENNVEIKAELKGITIALDFIKQFNEKQQIETQTQIKTQTQTIENIQQQTTTQETKQESIKEIPKQEETKQVKEKKHQIKDPYEALLAFKAKANKREMLKQKMISMINENGMNLSELKFMFVDHYKYCSKATFYNYLKELEIEKTIRVERENSKNILYLNMINKKNEF